MPLYEYRCTRCGHEWEVEQKITDPPIDRCPFDYDPDSPGTVMRLIGRDTSFVLRGSGWTPRGNTSQ